MNTSYQHYLSGHYIVGSQVYTHKRSALLACQDEHTWPTWNFFNDVFAGQDWQAPCNKPLQEIYQARARSLRQKYDWISISYSGGSDSFTVLQSFLDAGVFVDEIYVRWPFKALEHYQASRDLASSNIHSELDLSIRPQLSWFADQIDQRTMISWVDWSLGMEEFEHSADSWQHLQDYYNIAWSLKVDTMPPGFVKSQQQGQKSCVILGIDKPQLCVRDGNVYAYFLDKIAHNHPHCPWDQHTELFFWSGTDPQVPVAQAQALYQHICDRPDVLRLIDHSGGYDPAKKEKWEAVVRNIIYPDYDPARWFNAHKPGSMIFPETDQWIYERHAESKLVESWLRMYRTWFNEVPKRFLEHDSQGISGLVGFVSPYYLLGPTKVKHEL